ncbi:tetratricopeptide repeat protein [Pseudanabaena minima]|uniref:tetratricopeptide repeat protein n=1 Tax=Pseudanabaena minima TaxID=890415 RepID=UPI003DA9BCBB
MSGVVQRVDESVENTPEDEYKSLLRSLHRRKGFGLVFVRCSPVGGLELIQKVQDDLPQKQVGVLALDQPIDNLIDRVKDFPNQAQLNILFIVGLEKSLVDYIKTGYGGEGDYYNLDTIPPILSHLNWQRENFRDRFRHLCFIFLLPKFAVKYIIRRAPDFYDWASGKIDFPSSQESVKQELQRILLDGDYQKYLEWTPQQRKERILEINELLLEPNQGQNQQVLLLNEQGNIFVSNNQYEEAISCYNKVLEIKPEQHTVWFIKGVLLKMLGRNEESITSYDKALKIKPDFPEAWNNRGVALFDLGRYEEAIISYEKALQFNPEDEITWNNRGAVLFDLGRYEEAITSLDKSLTINPDDQIIWNKRGVALSNLSRNEEAIYSFDKAISINPDFDMAWHNRGITLGNLGRDEDSIVSYDKTLLLNSDLHTAWLNRGNALYRLGRNEEAIFSYNKALQIVKLQKDKIEEIVILNNISNIYFKTGRIKEMFSTGQRMIEVMQSMNFSSILEISIYPKWMKKLVKFGKSGRFQAISVLIMAIIFTPIWLFLYIISFFIFRFLKQIFPRRIT